MGERAKVFLFSALLFFFGSHIHAANAASLSIQPNLNNYSVGRQFTAAVYVSSPDQPLNAISGTLSFPADKLEIVSVSKTGSVMNVWVQDPSFSNTDGTAHFEGVVLNPGFKGNLAKVVSVIFRAKSFGLADVVFSSASILANDGLGTNILSGTSKAEFNLSQGGVSAPIVTNPSVSQNTPGAVQIFSTSHPDPNKWYANKDAKFSWEPLPEGVMAARILVGKIPNAIPTVVYTPAISSKDVSDIGDGTWYLSVQLKNSNGWGAISHFRFQIDTTPPEQFSIKFPGGLESLNAKPKAIFETTDQTSGVAIYHLKIDDGGFFDVNPNDIKDGVYMLPPVLPGKHLLLVQAEDGSGNISTAAQEFTTLALSAPKIISYSRNLNPGDFLNIEGKSGSNFSVTISLRLSGEEWKTQTVRADPDGKFSITWVYPLAKGSYSIKASAVDSSGANSQVSDIINLTVSTPYILQIGSFVINSTLGLLAAHILFAALLFFCFYGWYNSRKIKRSAKKFVRPAQEKTHVAFDALRESVNEHIRNLEKVKNVRQLTGAEEAVLKQLKKDLQKAEKAIEDEIKSLE